MKDVAAETMYGDGWKSGGGGGVWCKPDTEKGIT